MIHEFVPLEFCCCQYKPWIGRVGNDPGTNTSGILCIIHVHILGIFLRPKLPRVKPQGSWIDGGNSIGMPPRSHGSWHMDLTGGLSYRGIFLGSGLSFCYTVAPNTIVIVH